MNVPVAEIAATEPNGTLSSDLTYPPIEPADVALETLLLAIRLSSRETQLERPPGLIPTLPNRRIMLIPHRHSRRRRSETPDTAIAVAPHVEDGARGRRWSSPDGLFQGDTAADWAEVMGMVERREMFKMLERNSGTRP